jgi:parallel beta helix pectate lyase-like protein
MRIFTNSFHIFSVTLFLTISLSACSVNGAKSFSNSYSSNPEVNRIMQSTNSLDETVSSIDLLVKNDVLSAPVFKENTFETARILNEAQKSNVAQALSSLCAEQPQKATDFIELALRLFPSKKMQLIEDLKLDDSIDEEAIMLAAIRSGISPAEIVPPTASGETHRIVPLIHSASITLFDQNKENTTEVRFKKVGENQWKEGLHLYWEPVRQALSGSLVHLEADTLYEVEITLKVKSAPPEIKSFEFSTKPEAPPVDPDLVYNLRDIYNGGILDIPSLGINGTKEGWAKIVGDPDYPITASDSDYAIYIGNSSYILFEDIVVKGGRRHGIAGKYAHNLWFKNCDISQWGRSIGEFRDGLPYETKDDKKPINYDGGIALFNSGMITVENCKIHSPTPKSNHWGYGHPNGPTAMLIMGNHPKSQFEGQYIIKNNKFFGKTDHRFNDVIESRVNGKRSGGFVRDSAIYNNYFAYANDDAVEIDGGQSNVLFYDNEIEQAYCGISAAPNMEGPSYIFNNFIHNLGDERQKKWAAIKLGGLFSRPSGRVSIFNNLVITNANGIAHANFAGDSSFWIHAQNNIFIHDRHYPGHVMGYSISDPNKYHESVISNNIMFNYEAESPLFDANINQDSYIENYLNSAFADSVKMSGMKLSFPFVNFIPNFTVQDEELKVIVGKTSTLN